MRERTHGQLTIGLLVALQLVACGDDSPTISAPADGGSADAGMTATSSAPSAPTSSSEAPSESSADQASNGGTEGSSGSWGVTSLSDAGTMTLTDTSTLGAPSSADQSSTLSSELPSSELPSSGASASDVSSHTEDSSSENSADSSSNYSASGSSSGDAGASTSADEVSDASVSNPGSSDGTRDAGETDASDAAGCIPLAEPLTIGAGPALLSSMDASMTSVSSEIRDDAVADAAVYVAPDAGSEPCFPSCITELESLCAPGDVCNGYPGNGGLTACWDNGLRLDRTQAIDGIAATTSSRVYVDTQVCYTVEAKLYLNGSGASWTWLNSCGETVATAERIAGQRYSVTCADRNESKVVDMSQGACVNYADGAPNMFTCEQALGCP
jgi:hypothetical protein